MAKNKITTIGKEKGSRADGTGGSGKRVNSPPPSETPKGTKKTRRGGTLSTNGVDHRKTRDNLIGDCGSGEDEEYEQDEDYVERCGEEASGDHVLDLFDEIEEVLKKDGKMKEGEFQRTFFNVFRAMYGKLQEENSVLKGEVLQLRERVRVLENDKFHKDCQEAKRGVIIWNLQPILENGQDMETLESLRRYVSTVAKAADLRSESIDFVRRIRPSRMAVKKAQDSNSNVKRPILLRFQTIGEKFQFLKGLKNADLKGERYSQEYPFHLKEKAMLLEGVAYAIRQRKDGTKTRVAWQGDQLVLKTKLSGEREFSELPQSKWPIQ